MSDSETASIFEEDIFAIDEDEELENNFADGDEATEAEINSDIEEQADTFDEMADVPTQSKTPICLSIMDLWPIH